MTYTAHASGLLSVQINAPGEDMHINLAGRPTLCVSADRRTHYAPCGVGQEEP